MINIEDYMNWYYRADVKFELIKQLWHREFALLTPNWASNDIQQMHGIRMLKCHSVQHLDYIFKSLNIFRLHRFYNFFYSLAKYKDGIPNQTMNFKKRDNSGWKKIHHQQMMEYDFLLDIDCDDHNDIDFIIENVRDIKVLLDRLNVPYQLRFSGLGFHFIFPYKFTFKDSNLSFNRKDDNNIYRFYRAMAKKFYDKFSELIDLSIYDSRRICKLPYSLSLYKKRTYVCYPFENNDEFKTFRLSDYELCNFTDHIRDRGIFTFNRNGNINKLLKYFNLCIKK